MCVRGACALTIAQRGSQHDHHDRDAAGSQHGQAIRRKLQRGLHAEKCILDVRGESKGCMRGRGGRRTSEGGRDEGANKGRVGCGTCGENGRKMVWRNNV